jgi:hypothetical protein
MNVSLRLVATAGLAAVVIALTGAAQAATPMPELAKQVLSPAQYKNYMANAPKNAPKADATEKAALRKAIAATNAAFAKAKGDKAFVAAVAAKDAKTVKSTLMKDGSAPLGKVDFGQGAGLSLKFTSGSSQSLDIKILS